MFIVEIYNGDEWIKASQHTQKVDAENQIGIFKEAGEIPENLRITETGE